MTKVPRSLTLKCVTLAEPPFEQLALSVKQQLATVGINLEVEGVSAEQAVAAVGKNDFEVVLLELLSGWSLTRTQRWWHSQGAANITHFSNAKVDAALDQANRALNDSEYRSAIADLQEAMGEDPPAIFLAWSERSRAVSNRFDVAPEPGRDVLATLRMWHPRTDKVNATHH